MVPSFPNPLGSAYLVQSKIDNQFYVAKKMILEGMSPSEVASAWG